MHDARSYCMAIRQASATVLTIHGSPLSCRMTGEGGSLVDGAYGGDPLSFLGAELVEGLEGGGGASAA